LAVVSPAKRNAGVGGKNSWTIVLRLALPDVDRAIGSRGLQKILVTFATASPSADRHDRGLVDDRLLLDEFDIRRAG
jgi:hypothetical protein